jgi:hypothetical protein
MVARCANRQTRSDIGGGGVSEIAGSGKDVGHTGGKVGGDVGVVVGIVGDPGTVGDVGNTGFTGICPGVGCNGITGVGADGLLYPLSLHNKLDEPSTVQSAVYPPGCVK